MRQIIQKLIAALGAIGLVASMLAPLAVTAAVSVTVAPASLVSDPITVKASSAPIGLFSVTLSADAGETLNSVSVMVNQNGTTTVSSADLSNVAVYKDDGNGTFNSAGDTLLASMGTVNVGSLTSVNTGTSTVATGKFFVSISTGASFSDVAPKDSFTVTLPSNAIVTSSSSPTTVAVTTASITADITAPTLSSALAKNTGGTDAKEAGDSVELTFSENTNKPTINSGNINTFLSVNNGHSFLDTFGALGAASWNTAGNVLTLTLSGTSSPTSTLPSIVVGDVVSVVVNSNFTDLAQNQVSGTQAVTGNFGGQPADDGDEEVRGNCANGVMNGRLYKLGSSPTVYLAAACRLKPFRGQAVFKARGQKFQNIIVLASLPDNINLSDKPVLPVAGTLVKGSDKTVWFVDSHGKRRGFVSGKHFGELGFSFGKVQIISDTDLALIPSSNPIEDNEDHPDGAVIKCGNSPAVFQVIGNAKFPFVSGEAFTVRGNSFENVLSVDCGRFKYLVGAAVNQ